MAKVFSELALRPELQSAVEEQGYTHPTPIQAQAIPVALGGKDVLGIAQTGTGKTAAFTLPILQRLSTTPKARTPGTCRSLILTPTRELAIQIGESIGAYGRGLPSGPKRLTHTVIFGGVGQKPQTDAMEPGVDLLVATPGRLLDLSQQGFIRFEQVEVFVLDEADRMLDMGFIHDVKKVVTKLPPAKERQNFFFSATMPPEVAKLAQTLLRPNPVRVEVTPVATTAEKIAQGIIFCAATEKRQLVVDLLSDPAFTRVILFTRMKHEANKYAALLEKASIPAAAIHGNKSQSARQAALEGFKQGSIRVLCATDIAARGIDVEAVSHVVNTSLPDVPEQYVHRIGRTARAGAEGSAVSFCDPSELGNLKDIEKLTGQKILELARPQHGAFAVPAPEPDRAPAPRGRRPAPRPKKGSGATSSAPSDAQDTAMAESTNKRKRNRAGIKKDAPATSAAQDGPLLAQTQKKPETERNGSGLQARSRKPPGRGRGHGRGGQGGRAPGARSGSSSASASTSTPAPRANS